MSKRPTGTTTDDDRLHELGATDETAASTLAIDVGALADRMRASSGDPIDWAVDDDERTGLPMLVASAIDETATDDAPYPRRLREEADTIVAPVPDPLLEAEPPDGIGLDLADAGDRGLLFDAITTDETLGFVPVRFGDGEPFAAEPLPGAADEGDPVARETIERERDGEATPRPETVGAPIDADVLEATLSESDADASAVVDVLEGIERHDVLGPGDAVPGHPPLTVEGRAVCLLEDGFWTEAIAGRLEAAGVDVGANALEVARRTHDRQAERLAESAADEGYREAIPEREVAVTEERDTAEWEVADSGASR